jgi:hypothetical protein
LRNESVLRSSRSSSGVLGAPEELLCGLGIKAVVCKLKEDYQQCFTGREDLRDGQSLFLRDECLRTWHSGRRGRAPGIINERAVHLANVKGPHRSAHYYEEYDVRYCVLATLYHLNRLIDLYVELCQLFEHIPPGRLYMATPVIRGCSMKSMHSLGQPVAFMSPFEKYYGSTTITLKRRVDEVHSEGSSCRRTKFHRSS